jgi:hypothetical protein
MLLGFLRVHKILPFIYVKFSFLLNCFSILVDKLFTFYVIFTVENFKLCAVK